MKKLILALSLFVTLCFANEAQNTSTQQRQNELLENFARQYAKNHNVSVGSVYQKVVNNDVEMITALRTYFKIFGNLEQRQTEILTNFTRQYAKNHHVSVESVYQKLSIDDPKMLSELQTYFKQEQQKETPHLNALRDHVQALIKKDPKNKDKIIKDIAQDMAKEQNVDVAIIEKYLAEQFKGIK